MATIKGTDLVVKIGAEGLEEKLYCSTTCTLNLTQDTVQASCKDGEQWAAAVEGQKSWTVSVEGLYDDEPEAGTKGFIDLADLIIDGPNDSTLVFGQETPIEGDTYWSGQAILTSCSLTGPDNEFATWSAEFTGNGALTKTIEPAP